MGKVTQADRELAAYIAGCNDFPWTGQLYREGQLDDDKIMAAIVDHRATPDAELVEALRAMLAMHGSDIEEIAARNKARKTLSLYGGEKG